MTRLPLDGVRVVVARARAQSAGLIEALEKQGATAVAVPVIEIQDPADGGAALRAGLDALTSGDWLVITSPNGAARVAAALDGRAIVAGVSVAVIGPSTRARAESLGIHVDLEPRRAIAEGLLDFLPGPRAGGGTMLLARAESARPLLPDALRKQGWTVNDVPAYRTVGLPVSDEDIEECRSADVAAFTSASTVRHLHEGAGETNLPPVIACIGPATADQADALGVRVDITASEHTIPGLVAAISQGVRDLVLLRPEPADAAESQWMLKQYYAEIDERFEFGLDRDNVLTTDPAEISPPNGLFVAARLQGEPVGCAVLKIVEPGVADIKRMWVSDRVRGRGLGRRLLRRLVHEARSLGLRQVRLETNEALSEAIALYRAEGFVEVPAFNREPHAHHWFTLDLD